ncbi:MAG: HAD family phosphatase, partial [Pedobacter sp.]
IVLTTMHDKEDFAKYKNVVAFVKDYNDPVLTQLF